MPKLSNSRYEAFALAAASGAELNDACEDAGLRGGLSEGRHLVAQEEIIARVAELRQEQADLDEARPTAVIIALVRMARHAERLKTAAGIREARMTLLEAQRLHGVQSRERHDVRLTVLDDDEWEAIFRSIGARASESAAFMTSPPMIGQ